MGFSYGIESDRVIKHWLLQHNFQSAEGIKWQSPVSPEMRVAKIPDTYNPYSVRGCAQEYTEGKVEFTIATVPSKGGGTETAHYLVLSPKQVEQLHANLRTNRKIKRPSRPGKGGGDDDIAGLGF